jgi:hypothetical protein
MRTARRCGAAIALALAASVALSGCGLVDYYRDGGEQLWGHVSDSAAAEEALRELGERLEAEHPVETVAVQARVLGFERDAQIEVTFAARAAASDWVAVADDIAEARASDALDGVAVAVVLQGAGVRIENAEISGLDLAASADAALRIAAAWGVPIRIGTEPFGDQLRMTVAAQESGAVVTTRFVEAAPELRSIEQGLSTPVQWYLPGYSGAGIAPDAVLALLQDARLPLPPMTAAGDSFELDDLPVEYVWMSHHAERSTLGVVLAVDGHLDAAPGWSAFAALAQRAASSGVPVAVSASWTLESGDDAIGYIGGVRFPADDCVMPPPEPVSGLGLADDEVADALVRAGIPPAAFSVGFHCAPAA